MNKQYDVFFCHNSEDKPSVKKIGSELKSQGIIPWLDEWELRPGSPWQNELENQIENIKAAAVFVGSSGVGPWQSLELEAFLREFIKRKFPVIPVLLPNSPSTVELPVFLRGMSWVDFRKGFSDSGLNRLIWGITGQRVKTGIKEEDKEDESVSSYAPRPAMLYEVFSNTGFPDYTYIEPSIYRDVESDILQPGKHVLIIGPSGSGKTCLLTKILNSLNFKEDEDYLFVSSLDDESNERVNELLDLALNKKIEIPIVVDDFHTLDFETRINLGKKLKQLSDKVFRTREKVSSFILLGISTSAQALLFNATDLGRRLGIYKIPFPRPSDLKNLIERGEKKLTVEILNKEKIIDDSSNSFFICQYLCQRICIESQVTKTMDTLTILKYRIEDIRKHLIQQLSEQFLPFLTSFVHNSGLTKDEWYPFLAIIASISSSPKFQFTISEISSISKEYGLAIRANKEKITKTINSCGKDGKLGKILYYEGSAELFSIEDPIFRYYLNHIDFKAFIQSVGLTYEECSNIIDILNESKGKHFNTLPKDETRTYRDDIFISYSHEDQKWMEILKIHLQPLVRKREISIWVDSQIRAGLKWREEIIKAISRAKVAILLVSANFLASDFIAENELPPILKAAEEDGLKIIWIPINYCLYSETDIGQFQAALNPSTPLASLSEPALNKSLVEISRIIRDCFKESG